MYMDSSKFLFIFRERHSPAWVVSIIVNSHILLFKRAWMISNAARANLHIAEQRVETVLIYKLQARRVI